MDELRIQGIFEKGYGNIPKLVMQDIRLTRDSKAIYAYFCSYTGAGKTELFPSEDRICYDLQFKNVKTFRKHLKLLVSLGYISIKKNRNNKGQFKNNVYTINSIIKDIFSMGQNFPHGKKPPWKNCPPNNNNIFNNTNNKQQQHISSYVSDKNTQTVENNVKAVVVEDSIDKNISQNKEISGGKDKKELIKKEVDEVSSKELQEIQEIIGKFKEKYGGNLDESLTKKLILRKGKDKVLKCIDEMEQYVNNADKVERVFYDFVVNCDTNKYTKGTQYNSPGQKFAQGNKPIQATNYEQREYDDEFFDSLYLNLDEYYPDKNSLD